MDYAEFLTKAKRYIELCENNYFTTGLFCESTIKADLENRSEKKQFYLNDFNEVEKNLDLLLSCLPVNHLFAPRCKRCKEQIGKLRNLVQNFS